MTSPIKPHDLELSKNVGNPITKEKPQLTTNYFKTYASNMKNELMGGTSTNDQSNLINQSISNQQHQHSQLIITN